MFEDFENRDSNPEAPSEVSVEAIAYAGGSGLASANPTRKDLVHLNEMRTALLDLDLDLDAHELIEVMGKLEEIKSAIAAMQAMTATLYEAQVIARHRELDVHRTNRSYGAGAQIALARRESQDLGPRYLNFSKLLITDLPFTLNALTQGEISEQHAMIIARETRQLTVEDRQLIDKELMQHPHTVAGVGTRELTTRVKSMAYTFDSRDAVITLAEAEKRRYIAVFPTNGGTMTVHGILPLDKGLALQQALDEQAQSLKKSGDERTLDQIRCDIAVERITGNTSEAGTKVLVNLVMTDRTLFQGESEPAYLNGYGTVPASWARDLIAGRNQRDPFFSKALVSLIRLYTAPGTGQLVAMDSRQREFPKMLKHFIKVRDQICRTPYCNAAVKHLDHIVQHALEGPTDEANGCGRCARCNQTKEVHGWRETVVPGPRHTLEIQTPSGFTYLSTAPPLPGTATSG